MAASDFSIEEFTCPICMYILIQPVTLPCKHELCLPCFQQNVEEANFCCPMCRLRISTWARKASRNNALVNQERWQDIKRLFPEKVNKRLNGEDDEESDAVPVVIKLARPGEIRSEYEEQQRRLRQEYQEQRRKEQEASEQLIMHLQEQERKKREELQNLEKQDEELAKELSDIMNKADLASPYDTRSGSGATSESGSIKSFIETMKSNNQAGASPYPYPCFTPTADGKVCVDKDKALLLEQQFHKQKQEKDKQLLTTQDLLNLEKQYKLTNKRCNSKASATIAAASLENESRTNSTHSLSSIGQNSSLSQDEILQQMSEQLDLGTNFIDSPDCMIVEPKSVSSSSDRSDAKLALQNNRSISTESNKSNKSVEIIELENTPGISEAEKTRNLTLKISRSASSQSNDSISPELAHFRPIRACPLTPPRQLSGGRVVEPMLIRTTPRNLNKSFSTEEKSLSDIDASSPIMQKCLEQLEVERKDKVLQMSKSTTTSVEVHDSENRNPDPSRENVRKLHVVVNNLNNLNRATEFKDISNSPLSKRKYDPDETDLEETPKRKKLIIPLEPDLNENDDIFETSSFDIKIASVSPVKRNDDCKESNSKSSIKSEMKTKSKKKHKNMKNVSGEGNKGKDTLQSAITNWTCKQECKPHISNSSDVPAKLKNIESVDSNDQVKPSSYKHDKSKVDKHKTIDSYFEKSSEQKPKLRSREKLRQVRYPEYDYIEVSPRKRKSEVNTANSGTVSKLSFNSEGSDSEGSESVSENGKDYIKFKNEKNLKKQLLKSPFHLDDDDNDDNSFSVFSNKKRKTVSYKNDVKKRYKSGSEVSKASTSRCKAVKVLTKQNQNRTVDDFFKVNGNHFKHSNGAKTVGEIDGLVCGNAGHFSGVVSQEEQDRLLALELQKQFDFEHKYNLNTVRLKGSDDAYSFREKKKSA